MSTLPIDNVDVLYEPLKNLPPLEFAFAYGSAVFPQQNGRPRDVSPLSRTGAGALHPLHLKHNVGLTHCLQVPQTDYIVAVESPAAWHAEVGSKCRSG